jgi:hypothetical protein
MKGFDHYKQNRISNQTNRNNLEKSLPLIKSYQAAEYKEFLNKKSVERKNREMLAAFLIKNLIE